MTPEQIQIVKSTVPVLQQHGEEITSVFYRHLLTAHPELNRMFDPMNQKDGAQARRLAAAILAYAGNVDRLSNLSGAVDMIGHRHVSLGVLPEQYPVVGTHLLQAIKTVLGDAATQEIVDAWAAAYEQLAGIMIEHERALYAKSGAVSPH
jgi:nitric oxide dioxygenase